MCVWKRVRVLDWHHHRAGGRAKGLRGSSCGVSEHVA